MISNSFTHLLSIADSPKHNLRTPNILQDMIMSNGPYKRKNVNFVPKFIDEIFWKWLIDDCDDGLMCKNFIQFLRVIRLCTFP